MHRDQESDVRAPCGERATHPARPHGRMRRSADVAKEVGTPGLSIEGRHGIPVEPADVVLLAREKQRLSQWFGPGAKQLSRDPGVRGLADREDAGTVVAEQHRCVLGRSGLLLLAETVFRHA
ncbi:MAG TPA: hypothetical protein VFE60_05605 [Roseiarcus sp.]|nr:hypothetical protein [Roseiarcus sp.]